MGTVTLWDRDSLWVTASGGADGVRFYAQDLNPPEMFGDEYEYAFDVGQAEVPQLVQALGGSDPSEVLALLQANAERLIRRGIGSWLKDQGIATSGFWSWYSP